MEKRKRVMVNILAVVIGIATIIPIAYLSSDSGDGMATAQIVQWCKVDVPYAYVELYHVELQPSFVTNPVTRCGVMIDGLFNFTITPEVRELTGAVAQIEYYRVHMYSDQGSIVNRTYSIAVCGNYVITGSGGLGWYQFVDGTMFNGSTIFGEGFGGQCIPTDWPGLFTTGGFTMYIADYDEDEEAIKTVSAFRDAQTLYMEISKIGTVSYQLDSDSGAVLSTLIEDEVLYQMEFAKIESGFVYREFVEGTVGFPVYTPPATKDVASPSKNKFLDTYT